MRTPITRIEVLVGFFTLAVAVAAGAFFLASPGADGEELTLYLRLERTYGIAKGSAVKINELPVGRVTAVEFELVDGDEEHPVKVTLAVDPAHRRWVRRGARAEVVPALIPGLAGTELHLELRREGEAARPGEQLPSDPPADMLAEMRSIPGELRAMLEPALQSAQKLVANAEQITRDIAERRGFVGALIADPELRDDVAAMASAVKRFFEGIEQSTPAIMEAIENMTQLAEHSNTMVGALGGSVEGMQKAFERTVPQLDRLGPLLDEAEKTLASARRAMADIEHLSATAKRMADGEVARILANVDRSAADLPALTRRVDAALFETSRLLEALQNNVFIRSYMPAAEPPSTELGALPRGGRRD